MKINISRQRLLGVLASETFFRLTVGLLIVQALWLALTGLYPMAFDEGFHLGIIRLYADHISPFWSSHPAGADALGAVARDPSYLFHWLMSFPYRFISAVTDNFATQVVWLRMINIALFASGLYLYRRLLLKTGASRAIVHFCLLIFVLVPIVPLLAAQINYDNLILPLTAGTLLLTLRFSDNLTKQRMDVRLLWQLLLLCMLASLVKYAFLPIFVAIILFIGVRLYRGYKAAAFKEAFLNGLRIMGKQTVVVMLVATLLVLGLFVERYGVNLIQYHAPVADCGEVLDYDHCKAYGPWLRDYQLAANKTDVDRSPLTFTHEWLYGMWFRSFFAVDGPTTNFQTRGPLTMPGLGAAGLAVLAAAAFILTAKRLWRGHNRLVLWLFSFAIVTHVLILWQDQYQMFLHTGKAVAINGRYLLPILPMILLLAALSLKELTRGRERIQSLLALVVVICFVWGGGALTYILRSNDSWYWDGALTKDVNHAIQQTVGPLTPGYNNPIQFLP